MKKNRGPILTSRFIILAVAILVAGIGLYAWRINDSSSNKSESYKRTTTTPANWKTYTDSSYKFSFAYPPDWLVSSRPYEIVQPSNDPQRTVKGIEVGAREPVDEGGHFTLRVTRETLDEALAARQGVSIKKTLYTIDGRRAAQMDLLANDDGSGLKPVLTDYYIGVNGFTYTSEFWVKDNDQKVPQTMFESLKIQ